MEAKGQERETTQKLKVKMKKRKWRTYALWPMKI